MQSRGAAANCVGKAQVGHSTGCALATWTLQFWKPREVSVCEESSTSDREPECHIEPVNCVAASEFQSVRGAAAASVHSVSTAVAGGSKTWRAIFFCAGAGGIFGSRTRK